MGTTCGHCKSAKAAVKVLDIKNGKQTELYFCNKCAQELGIMQSHIVNLLHILKGASAPAIPAFNPKCDECGMTLSQFKKNMRAGCPNDYLVFGLGPLLQQYHGADRHVGKVPSTFKQEVDRQQKLKNIQTALDAAVKAENYEEAARLRDEITKMGKES